MSGMKFRLQCASCGTTFFGPDRKTRYCPKCLKKRAGKAPVETEGATKPRSATPRATPPIPRATHQANSRAGSDAIGVARAEMTKSPPKSHEMTAELRERIEQIYRERFAGSETAWRDMVAHISDQVWLNRKVVSAALHEIVYPMVPITPEMESRIIDMYRGYVERGERPENYCLSLGSITIYPLSGSGPVPGTEIRDREALLGRIGQAALSLERSSSQDYRRAWIRQFLSSMQVAGYAAR
jgi:hypothetical protein